MMDTFSLVINSFGADVSYKKFTKGTYIYHEGQSTDQVFIVRKGRVKLVNTLDHDHGEFVRHIIYPEEFLGIGEFTTRMKSRQLSAIAIDKEVIVMKIPYFKFEMELRKNQQLVFTVLDQLIRNQKNIWARCFRKRHLSTIDMVMSTLLDIAKERGSVKDDGIAIQGLTHHDLASYIGLCRQSTTTSLNTLRRKNRIRYSRNEILILFNQKCIKNAGIRNT